MASKKKITPDPKQAKPVKKVAAKKPAAKKKKSKKAPTIRHSRPVLDEMAKGLDLDPSLFATRGDVWQAIQAAQAEAENTGGRRRRWTWAKALEEDIERYLQDPKEKIKSVVGFCVYAKVSRMTLSEYRAGTYDSKKEDFSYTIKSTLDPRCERELLDNGLQGDFSAPVTIFALKNLHAYADKLELMGPGGESLDGGSKMVDATNAIAAAMEKHFTGPKREGVSEREFDDGE